jgi:hypothetical protein
MIGCSTSSGLLLPILVFENCGEIYISEYGVPNLLYASELVRINGFVMVRVIWMRLLGKEGEILNAVSAMHEDA